MSLAKKLGVLALVAIALLIPAVALSENAAGKVALDDNSLWVSNGFDDRTDGTITVRIYNDDTVPADVLVTITDPVSGHVYVERTVTVPGEAGKDFGFSFRISSPGTYYLVVEISGADVGVESSLGIYVDVGRSIWSNTWTYVAIVIVIIVILIAGFIRMRGMPKADNAGAFTAMEEERKAGRGRSGAGKEEYKGRSKK
jgi:hypothetical protein